MATADTYMDSHAFYVALEEMRTHDVGMDTCAKLATSAEMAHIRLELAGFDKDSEDMTYYWHVIKTTLVYVDMMKKLRTTAIKQHGIDLLQGVAGADVGMSTDVAIELFFAYGTALENMRPVLERAYAEMTQLYERRTK